MIICNSLSWKKFYITFFVCPLFLKIDYPSSWYKPMSLELYLLLNNDNMNIPTSSQVSAASSELAFTCSKLAIETLEQGMKYVRT